MLFNSGSHLNNLGEVSGVFAGVWVASNPGAPVVLVNAGTMSGGDEAIFISGAQTTVLTNTGTILGGAAGSSGSADNSTSPDTIHNRSPILGDIHFSLGADLYDGRGGSNEGTVFGEAGDDGFIAGLAVESFDGGAGKDTQAG